MRMPQVPRLTAQRAQSRTRPLWLWPVVAGVVAFVAGSLLVEVHLREEGWLARFTKAVDTEAASSLMQVVAGSAITVTTLTFSLTILALQLASQQFSPRLLREFTRDPVTRVVLAVLVATFVMALTVLRNLNIDESAPALAVLAVFLMGLLSLGTVLAFITHIARILRVDSMMSAVHGETATALAVLLPDRDDREGPPSEPSRVGTPVAAEGSGFVRLLDSEALVQAAARADAFVRVEVCPGDLLVRGTPVATLWRRDDAGADEEDQLVQAVRDAVRLSFERTMEQDPAYGFRQLTDIAVKALSPAVNDPVTAVHAVGHMSDLVVRLLSRGIGRRGWEDSDGTTRVLVADRDLRYYLDLVCGQLRRYGSSEPTLLVALLRLLRDAATAARSSSDRAEITRQADLVVAACDSDVAAPDREAVTDLRRRVELALGGDIGAAYRDRAGETRSI